MYINISSLTGKPEGKLMILFELLICPLFIFKEVNSMNYQLNKRLSLLEKRLGVSDVTEVTYVILGDDKSYAVANGNKMSIEQFRTEHPNFNPTQVNVSIG